MSMLLLYLLLNKYKQPPPAAWRHVCRIIFSFYSRRRQKNAHIPLDPSLSGSFIIGEEGAWTHAIHRRQEAE